MKPYSFFCLKVKILSLWFGFQIFSSISTFGTESILMDSITQDTTKKMTIVPLPVIYYTPETHWAFGALGQFLFKMSAKDTASRTSSLQVTAIYTANKQYLANTTYNVFFDQEKYWLNGYITYKKFPEFFYGLGNNTSLENRENFSYFSIDWAGSFVRKIKKGTFLGITHKFQKMYDVVPDPDTFLENSTLAGARGFRISGIGLTFIRDERNSIINASRGFYLEFSTRLFRKMLGSEYEYEFYRIDARKYFSLSKNQRHILAFQALGEFRSGTVPIHRLSRMGGEYTMRGHYIGRYRDNQYWTTQAEYRFPIYKFLGGVGFAGMGNVCQSCIETPFDKLKYSVGSGLRFMIDKTERLNIRLDYAFIRDDSNFYIQITEAF